MVKRKIYLCRMAENHTIKQLRDEDVEALITLVNSAYRGEGSKKGWTTEADIIEGSLRVDLQSIKDMLLEPGAAILTCHVNDILSGCVYLKAEGTSLYLGMLCVSPEAQGLGIGKKLLIAAEVHAQEFKYADIHMTVIDIRHELIAWYERHGYSLTGETKPFHDDERFGKAIQPIKFIVLKKMINA